MNIQNKQESSQYIQKLQLNRFCETIFYQGERQKVEKFLKENPAPLYVIRNKKEIKGKQYIDITAEEVLKHIDEFEIGAVDISFNNYEKQKVLIGDIYLSKTGELYLHASTNKKSVHRRMLEPIYDLKTTIYDCKLKSIPGIELIVNYLYQYELIDVIVEFGVFSEPIGINKEPVVIFELRSQY